MPPSRSPSSLATSHQSACTKYPSPPLPHPRLPPPTPLSADSDPKMDCRTSGLAVYQCLSHRHRLLLLLLLVENRWRSPIRPAPIAPAGDGSTGGGTRFLRPGSTGKHRNMYRGGIFLSAVRVVVPRTALRPSWCVAEKRRA